MMFSAASPGLDSDAQVSSSSRPGGLFVAMAPSLGDAAFYSAYSSELNQFRSDAIQFCAKIVAMALGWNPLRAGDAIFWRSLSPGFGIFDQLSGTGHI